MFKALTCSLLNHSWILPSRACEPDKPMIVSNHLPLPYLPTTSSTSLSPLPQMAKGCDWLGTIHKKNFYYNNCPSDKCDQLERFPHWAKQDVGKTQSYRYPWEMCSWCCRAPGLKNSLQAQPSSHTTPVCWNCSPLTWPESISWKGSSTSCSPSCPRPL